MSRIEQGKSISQQPIQPKTEGVAKTAKSAEKADFNLLSKFREFRQRATLLGFLTLAGIMGSCGDNPLTDSSIVETQDNVKKTPDNKPLGYERKYETYNVKDFLLNEMLTGYQCAHQKEQERIENNLYVHSRGEPALLLIGPAVPFVEVLKKRVKEENPPGLTEQEKKDKLIEMIVGDNIMNCNNSQAANLQFIITKQLNSSYDKYDCQKSDNLINEGAFFYLTWSKTECGWLNRKEVPKLSQIDTRNLYAHGVLWCRWRPADDFERSIVHHEAIVKESEVDYTSVSDKSTIKPGSNSRRFAWSHQLQDIVLADNQLIFARAFIYKKPRPKIIQMQLLDTPIPVE